MITSETNISHLPTELGGVGDVEADVAADLLTVAFAVRRDQYVAAWRFLEERAEENPALMRWRRTALRVRILELTSFARELGLALPELLELDEPPRSAGWVVLVEPGIRTHIARALGARTTSMTTLCGKPTEGLEPAIADLELRRVVQHARCLYCVSEAEELLPTPLRSPAFFSLDGDPS